MRTSGGGVAFTATGTSRVGGHMLKILGWVVGIIFLVGLLVVFGVFDLIF